MLPTADTVIRSIRRYPVKAMGGESLASVRIDERGLVGDRWYAVHDADGRFACGKDSKRFRRRDEVFGYAAATNGEQVTVRGEAGSWTVGDPALDVELTEVMGAPVRVAPEGAVPHFDDAPISIVGTATLAWCAENFDIDADSRRLRVNFVVQTDEPFAEEGWLDREVAIGSTRLRIARRIQRCRTIDLVQDGTTARGRWLIPVTAERDMCVAVYADIVTPGEISVGDAVHLV